MDVTLPCKERGCTGSLALTLSQPPCGTQTYIHTVHVTLNLLSAMQAYYIRKQICIQSYRSPSDFTQYSITEFF